MVARGILTAGSHLEGSEKAGDQNLQLLNIFFFRFNHSEHKAKKRETNSVIFFSNLPNGDRYCPVKI